MSRPSAPGVSVDLSGAAKVAARRLRRLWRVVAIDFNMKAGSENELMAWYRSRSDRLVRALQLRREREGPYFHQFVVFELNGNGGLFRIDRRLRPDEDSPMNSLKDEGIPAYDTIEPVVAWDDSLFPESDCLISIEFKVDVYLALILKICRAIQAHPLAKVYTLQRYNCYFFAQTILLCIACGVSSWNGSCAWFSEDKHYIPVLEKFRALNSDRGLFQSDKTTDKIMDYSASSSKTLIPVSNYFTYEWCLCTLSMTPITISPPRQFGTGIRTTDLTLPHLSTGEMELLRRKVDFSIQHLIRMHQERRLFAVHIYSMTRSVWDAGLIPSLPARQHYEFSIVVEHIKQLALRERYQTEQASVIKYHHVARNYRYSGG
ncbi:hypothetical protein RSOL_072250 [Rhizoctonia solani AG-3 Rhs1AP]|uniref:Uncharacterized protein n=2 Tax=Rhizoctonia solani AG-3 TaxID=1086053 RepID=A0A074RH39_9AGAM|nr:hypothetical protein RSOL_072250 [Rhizoctonia solani AG-3 Rhs1AP]KEP46094.1 hypothetical protein V565_219220 [Rhizoctonia solani 123E]